MMDKETFINPEVDKGGGAFEESGIIGFNEIKTILPHREPFILIDRVLKLKKKESILCLKNISGNDPWFRGHFPDFAIMPGALMIEALAQATLILAIKSYPDLSGKIGVFGAVKARFLKIIVPGDQVLLEVKIDKMIPTGGIVSAQALLNDAKAITASLTFGLIDKKSLRQ